jgi:hypothetical protein
VDAHLTLVPELSLGLSYQLLVTKVCIKIIIADRSFESAGDFRYFGKIVTD